MQIILKCVVFCLVLHLLPTHSWAEYTKFPLTDNKEQGTAEPRGEEVKMLTSLLELQRNLKEQIQSSQQKLKNTKSETERTTLKEELAQLDRQF